MTSRFELFIAGRYLRARRKEAVISVITVISVLGVAAGVMALVIALAVNNGFRNTLQRNLLGAMAHINVMPRRSPATASRTGASMAARLRKLPHVTAVSPALYSRRVSDRARCNPRARSSRASTSTRELAIERHAAPARRRARSTACAIPTPSRPGIILGSRLAEDIGMRARTPASNVISPQGELTPFGPRPATRRFKVVGHLRDRLLRDRRQLGVHLASARRRRRSRIGRWSTRSS